MTKDHASQSVIARGNVVHLNTAETQESPAPQILELFLDTDAMYRWYEEGRVSEAEGASLRTAIESGRLKWPNLEVIEVRGRTVESGDEIPDSYAADELEKKAAKAISRERGA